MPKGGIDIQPLWVRTRSDSVGSTSSNCRLCLFNTILIHRAYSDTEMKGHGTPMVHELSPDRYTLAYLMER